MEFALEVKGLRKTYKEFGLKITFSGSLVMRNSTFYHVLNATTSL